MKVGILTFHRAHNYGAVLQCYALQEYLKGMGHSVDVIDYRQPAIEYLYSIHWKQFLKSIPFSPIGQLKCCLGKLKRGQRFNDFRNKYLSLSRPCTCENVPEYDAYIVGSDQLWVPELTGGILDSVYTGNFIHSRECKLIGYAISTNARAIEQMGNSKLVACVENFDTLAFREKEITDIVGEIAKRKLNTVVDPTLLAHGNVWNNIDDKKWQKLDYILVYHLPSRFNNLSEKDFFTQVKVVAKRDGCEVISLFPMKYSVEDFVSLFRYARGVITTSFHATVFSLLFERKFMYIQTGDAYDVRCIDLLKSLSADNAIRSTKFGNERWPELDFDAISANLLELRKKSEKYLVDCLS